MNCPTGLEEYNSQVHNVTFFKHFTDKYPLRTESEWWYLELIDILAGILKLSAYPAFPRLLGKVELGIFIQMCQR